MAHDSEHILEQLVRQHEQFLSELLTGATSSLLAENALLTNKLNNMKKILFCRPPTQRSGAICQELAVVNSHADCIRSSGGGSQYASKKICALENLRPADAMASDTADSLVCAFPNMVGPSRASMPDDVVEGVIRDAWSPHHVEGQSEATQAFERVEPTVVRSSEVGFGVTAAANRTSRRLAKALEARRDFERKKLWETRRLQALFELAPTEFVVSAHVIYQALSPRFRENRLSHDQVLNLVQHFQKFETLSPCESRPFGTSRSEWREDSLSIEVLVQLILEPTMLRKTFDANMLADGTIFLDVVGMVTIDDIVKEVTRQIAYNGNKRVATLQHVSSVEFTRSHMTWWFSRFMAIVVALNFVTMGISVDRYPTHTGWICLEAFYVVAYCSELVVNIRRLTCRGYFFGAERAWNWVELLVTLSSLLQFIFSCSTLADWSIASRMSSQEKTSRAIRIFVILRVVQIVRLVRFISAVRYIAKMLAGFLIGMPALVCVLAFFGGMLWVFGIIFRLMFGPTSGQDYLSKCGDPDELSNIPDEACPLHYLYGEQYFNTVPITMFTCFRFMVGDFASYGGHHIVIALSRGYGSVFNLVFVSWMIVCVFGLFNIITAIFLDSTTAGLKSNELMQKYAKQYERKFVRSKVHALLERIAALHLCHESDDFRDICQMNVDLEAFERAMRDTEVCELMEALDVDVKNPQNVFATFDSGGSGKTTWPAILSSILNLRGEAHKADIVASRLLLKSLHSKIDNFGGQIESMQLEASRK